ncbi:MAG TPA: FAD-dependent oxidoreductase [Syntrophales bacterium]|nr:FAD-dependent oxidoreductase [Syntrophales bacterium]
MDFRKSLDVAIIGGGPAGVSACLELAGTQRGKVALFESGPELGGIPRTCHVFFGMRDLGRLHTGPAYARKLDRLARRTSTEIHVNATVMQIVPGENGAPHRLQVGSPEGYAMYEARTVLLATGCYESPRDTRLLPGLRPAGIFTTGSLQELVRNCGSKPGKRAIILGSEIVALSCVLTLRHAGTAIEGLVEEDDEVQTYPWLARSMGGMLGIPLYTGTSVQGILGTKRVEGVRLMDRRTQKIQDVACDAIILTGRFRAYSPLIDGTPIGYDPATYGPAVDMNLMTTVPGIFAAGNVLRGADMHDLCALEGRRAARGIVAHLKGEGTSAGRRIPVSAEDPVRYVVPQRILPEETKACRSSLFQAGPSIQLAHAVKQGVFEAWSGSEVIWRKPFKRLPGNTRIPLPLEEFNWRKADRERGVVLKVAAS